MYEDQTKLVNNYQEPAPSYQDATYGPPQTNYVQNVGYVSPMSPPAQISYQTIPVVQNQVILVGGCPVCRVGVLQDDYSFLGICCAIVFFPIGLLCCLATKQRRCTNCGAIYG